MGAVISFVGMSNTGKTTLIEKLIPIFKGRGYKVAAIKHSHKRLNLDPAGKDSYRLYAAGADISIAAGADSLSLAERNAETSIDSLAEKYLVEMDLVMTEGYKSGDKPKVEVSGMHPAGPVLCLSDESIFAVVSEMKPESGAEWFRPEKNGTGEAERLADLIEEKFLKKKA